MANNHKYVAIRMAMITLLLRMLDILQIQLCICHVTLIIKQTLVLTLIWYKIYTRGGILIYSAALTPQIMMSYFVVQVLKQQNLFMFPYKHTKYIDPHSALLYSTLCYRRDIFRQRSSLQTYTIHGQMTL